MVTRVGIELSPVTCRIVEVDARSRRALAGETRVRSYAVLPTGSTEFREKLTALRRREAAVVVWGARSVHQQVFVPERRYDQMREDALALTRDAGVSTAGVLADIAPSGASQKGNRPVLLAMASADELSLAVRPLLDAGLRLRSVTTPAGALTSLARVRRDAAFSQEIEAYVALEETATALALVRDGSLVAARELAWGFLADGGPSSQRPRQEMATRLIAGIAELCASIAVAPPSIGQMAICGGLPELRSLAALMTERIDLEVEPLDSLFAIDSTQLPEPSDEFRERSAELRLAWAVVADWAAPINLMRPRQRQAARARLARAVVLAGVGVGLGAGWLIARGVWLQSNGRVAGAASSRPIPQVTVLHPQTQPQLLSQAVPPSVAAARATPPAPPPSPAASTRAAPLTPPPSPAASARAAPLTPPPPLAAVTQAPLPPPLPFRLRTPVPPPAAPVQPASVQPGSVVAARVTPLPSLPGSKSPQSRLGGPPPASTPPPASMSQTPAVTRPPVAVTSPPVATGEPAPALARPQSPPARARERPPVTPVPFNAVLGTILYSADRRLAIIDGRIVGVGEEVKGARVIDIAPNVVTLRDSQGQLRTLTLASTGR